MPRKTKQPPTPSNPVERYGGVSTSILSVARHYGRATVQGSLYHYDSVADELIREDVLKREGQWKVVRAGEGNDRDDYALTTTDPRAAKGFIEADRSGRLLGLFGPDGWVGFWTDGKLEVGR